MKHNAKKMLHNLHLKDIGRFTFQSPCRQMSEEGRQAFQIHVVVELYCIKWKHVKKAKKKKGKHQTNM